MTDNAHHAPESVLKRILMTDNAHHAPESVLKRILMTDNAHHAPESVLKRILMSDNAHHAPESVLKRILMTDNAHHAPARGYLAHPGVIGLNADAVQDLLDVTCAGALFASEGREQVSSYVTHPITNTTKYMH